MAIIHVVKQGECLSAIAAKYGFSDFRVIYDAPANASFRAKRPNPNLIFPGDEIVIPDRSGKTASIATGKLNTITVKVARRTLRIVLRDLDRKPLAGIAYRLEVDGADIASDQVTGDDGSIEHDIPITAELGSLHVDDQVIPLNVGHLNPMSEDTADQGISGAQARLSNLGYDVAGVTGTLDDATSSALAQFQTDLGLEVSALLDDETRRKLTEVYGC